MVDEEDWTTWAWRISAGSTGSVSAAGEQCTWRWFIADYHTARGAATGARRSVLTLRPPVSPTSRRLATNKRFNCQLFENWRIHKYLFNFD